MKILVSGLAIMLLAATVVFSGKGDAFVIPILFWVGVFMVISSIFLHFKWQKPDRYRPATAELFYLQGDEVKTTHSNPSPRRWPLPGLAALLVLFIAVPALVWAGTSLARAQDGYEVEGTRVVQTPGA